MGLTLQEARALAIGTVLAFGTPRRYTVKRVNVAGVSIRLELERDDGFETFAGESDLYKASIVGEQEAPSVEAAEQSISPDETNVDTGEQEAPPPHVQIRKRTRKS